MRKLRIPSVLAAALGPALIIVAIAQADPSAPQPLSVAPPAPAPVADAQQQFDGLAAKPEVADSDPAAQRVAGGAEELGEQPAAVDSHVLQRGGTRMTVGVGPRVTCVDVATVNGAGSTSCTSTAAAIAPDRPMISVDKLEAIYQVTAVFADGVARNVTVTDSAGSTVNGTLDANVFTAVTDNPPVSAQWTDANGEQHTEPLSS